MKSIFGWQCHWTASVFLAGGFSATGIFMMMSRHRGLGAYVDWIERTSKPADYWIGAAFVLSGLLVLIVAFVRSLREDTTL